MRMVTLIHKRPKKSTEDLKENNTHSNGARNAKREEENRRRTSRKQAEADHEAQGDRKVQRRRRGEQCEDRGNTTNVRGETSSHRKTSKISIPESKVMLQDKTRKRKDVIAWRREPGV